MKKNILLVALSLMSICSFAQQKQITFTDSLKINTTNYFDYFKVAESASFDGYFLGSKYDDFSVLMKYYVAKTDFAGQLLWDTVHYFQEPFTPYGPQAIHSMVSQSGELIYSSEASGTNSNGRIQPFITNVDNSGAVNWNKYYEIDTLDFFNTQILKSSDGGYVLYGGVSDFSSLGVSSLYGFAYKLDSSGTLQWSKFYADKDTTEFAFTAGAGTSDDKYIFAGNASNSKSGGGRPLTPTSNDNFMNVVAVDMNGDLLWNSALYFDSPVDNTGSFDVKSVNVTSSQKAIVSFTFYNTLNLYNELGIAAFDINTGAVDWAKYYSLETDLTSLAVKKVIQKKDGSLVVFYDDFSSDAKSDLLELDYNGNIIQNKTIQEYAGSNTFYNDIIPTADGGVFVAANLFTGTGVLNFKTNKSLNTNCPNEYTFTTPTVGILTFDTYTILDTIIDVTPIEGSLSVMSEAEITSTNDVYCSCELNINGTIYISGSGVDSVLVSVYKYDPFPGKYIIHDSIATDVNGNYSFNYLPEGDYIIKAKPSKIKYPTYLPTYYSFPNGSTRWDSAAVYSVFCGGSPMPINIDLIQKFPQSGGWQCNGYVLEYYGYNSGLRRAPGDPIPDIDITIDQSPGGSINSATTDLNGYYAFTGLNNNVSFVLRVDIPGLPNDSIYTFVVNPGDPAMDSLNFYIDTVGVYILPQYILTGVGVISSKDLNVNILPNPTTSNFVLEINAINNSKMNIKLMNSIGEVVLSKTPNIIKGLNQVEFELQNQPPGIYFLSINYDNKHFVKKIIKQ